MKPAHYLVSTLAALSATTGSAAESAPTTASYHYYDGVPYYSTACNTPFPGGSIDRITAYTNLGKDLICGDCVQITNLRTNAKITVTVVDMGGSIFDLSFQAFKALDTDGTGYRDGHLDITYSKTSCSGTTTTPPTTTPTTTPTMTPSTTSPTMPVSNPTCGTCKACLRTYPGGTQCLTTAAKVECDAWGTGYAWCSSTTPVVTMPAPTPPATTPNPTCGLCKGCLWTYSGGTRCFTTAAKVECDAWGTGYTWC
ncbi:hypothetical protein PR002_g25988 [Phytophthora rubi]|uniref:Barwin domain-containing protein n=1 Tax=Phytophthora rubi TaxID=129364 RepID=A0A6A3I1E8_9STRA|nr:hypothetical protein PR002_g25988 [Phytophthora rubi]